MSFLAEAVTLLLEACTGGDEEVKGLLSPLHNALHIGRADCRPDVGLGRGAPVQTTSHLACEVHVGGVGGHGAVVLDHREGEGTGDGAEGGEGLVNTRVLADREECRPVKDAASVVAEGGRRGTRGRQAEAEEDEEGGGGGGVGRHSCFVGGWWWWCGACVCLEEGREGRRRGRSEYGVGKVGLLVPS